MGRSPTTAPLRPPEFAAAVSALPIVAASDVLVPQRGLLVDELLHQAAAGRVVGDHDLDSALPEELLVAAEIGVLADHHPLDAELDNRAGAHHAGRQRGIENGVVVTPAPARILQAIHLAMGDR